jgi:hypothetical protein
MDQTQTKIVAKAIKEAKLQSSVSIEDGMLVYRHNPDAAPEELLQRVAQHTQTGKFHHRIDAFSMIGQNDISTIIFHNNSNGLSRKLSGIKHK